jgi:hypothetical protein
MALKRPENIKKFTYGHQFEPEKASLHEYVNMIVANAPSRASLEQNIRENFFSGHSSKTSSEISDDNQKKLSMNCFLSLRAYKLLCSDQNNKDHYQPSDLVGRLQATRNEEDALREFAKHILINLSGTDLLKAIETVNERGEKPTLLSIISELNEMGYELSKNSIYPSTMRQWLTKAGLFEGQYKIAWDVYYDMTGMSLDFVDDIYELNPEQKYFLISMIELGVTDFIHWPQIVERTQVVKHLNYDMKMFPKLVLAPLVDKGVIEMNKTTGGRGAKPNEVRLTEQGVQELLLPFLKNVADLVSLNETELNRSFESILTEIDDPDKHVKGKALELLAVWMIRLCGLRFTEWRKRDAETGKGEVDLMAASDTFVYSRWQVQCKNTSKVDIDVVAKEIGMTFMTKADVVFIVTTGRFTSDAIQYADTLCAVSRYYLILIDGEDLKKIRADRTSVIPILNKIARRTFVRKEFGMAPSEADAIANELEEDVATAHLEFVADATGMDS